MSRKDPPSTSYSSCENLLTTLAEDVVRKQFRDDISQERLLKGECMLLVSTRYPRGFILWKTISYLRHQQAQGPSPMRCFNVNKG